MEKRFLRKKDMLAGEFCIVLKRKKMGGTKRSKNKTLYKQLNWFYVISRGLYRNCNQIVTQNFSVKVV